MKLPKYIKTFKELSIEHKCWVDELPGLVNWATKKWNLSLGKTYVNDVSCSYVVACFVNKEHPAVLKIGFPHSEADHEIEGLLHLNGNPTVKILDYRKSKNIMLLEQCNPGTSLKRQDHDYQDKIVCQILNEIWTAGIRFTKFRPLKLMVEQWNRETVNTLYHFPNKELAIYGCELKEELVSTMTNPVLLATDLHAGNILKAQRNGWLAIDIKPYIGDRAYDLTQHILNNTDRLEFASSVFLSKMAVLAEVDPMRLIKWVQARLYSENRGRYQSLGQKLEHLQIQK